MKQSWVLIFLAISLLSCEQHANRETAHNNSDHGHDKISPPTSVKILEKQVIEATSFSPEFIQLARNVEVIQNIDSVKSDVGVLTHEGMFGALLFAENIRAFYIELKPGMFLGEHPHPTESIVFTVKGKWVLCSEGKRLVMETGSLFHFGSNMPTGWEAPFAEGALLLVVKSKKEGEDFEPYKKGLLEMKATLDQERKDGESFYFNELAPDHPAVIFARRVNPNFDDVLKSMPY